MEMMSLWFQNVCIHASENKSKMPYKYSIHVHWAIVQILLPYPLSIFTEKRIFFVCLSICVSFAHFRLNFNGQFHVYCMFLLCFAVHVRCFFLFGNYYSLSHSCMSISICCSLFFLFSFMFVLEIEHVFAILHHRRHHHQQKQQEHAGYLCVIYSVYFLAFFRKYFCSDGSKWDK